jgi:predicted alpha/beta hydrolase family esterase
MKKQVFYIHGGESFVEYDSFLDRLHTRAIWDLPNSLYKRKWTDTLALDLGDDYEVFTPQMPNKQNAKYFEWSIWFERHFEHLHDDVVLVGCSLGAMFLLRYLSENNFPYKVKALYVLAAAVTLEGYDDSDSGDFVCELDSIPPLQEKVESIYILHSKDDFLVPFEHALKLKDALPKAELVTFEDKNHFLGETFPELVEGIKGLG